MNSGSNLSKIGEMDDNYRGARIQSLYEEAESLESPLDIIIRINNAVRTFFRHISTLPSKASSRS